MALLTDPNPASYNGYTFPVSTETVQFDQEPVFDEADRTILFIRYRIGLQFSLSSVSAANIDSTVAGLRQTLMARGGVFAYENRGFGADFSVGPGEYEDVRGGPRPVAFSFKPKGGNRAAVITWTIELCLPSHCTYSVFGVLMTFNYKVRFRIDRHGYTTRTYTGFVQIPKVHDQHDITIADQFLDDKLPPVPPKYQRTERDYDHSLDKTRVDFNLVDEEMVEAALPPGCTDASGSHDVGSSWDSKDGAGFNFWNGTISGRYVVAPPYRMEVAWKAFKDLLQHRLDIINVNINGGELTGVTNLDEQKPAQRPRVSITSLRMSEPEIYKSTAFSFSATYQQICTLKDIIGDTEIKTGLFRYPVTGFAAWSEWASSLGIANSHRGLAQVRLNPADEIIVDLCQGDSAAPPLMETTFQGGDLFGDIGNVLDLQPTPDVDASWFFYEPEIEVYEDHHAVVSSSLIEEEYTPYTQSPGDLTLQGYMPDEKPSDPTDSVQHRAPSTLYIAIAGQAKRAWFPIPRPKIVSWNGFQVKRISTRQDGCFWRQKNVGSLGIGMPLYYAEWRDLYAVEARPAQPIRPPVSLAEQN